MRRHTLSELPKKYIGWTAKRRLQFNLQLDNVCGDSAAHVREVFEQFAEEVRSVRSFRTTIRRVTADGNPAGGSYVTAQLKGTEMWRHTATRQNKTTFRSQQIDAGRILNQLH